MNQSLKHQISSYGLSFVGPTNVVNGFNYFFLAWGSRIWLLQCMNQVMVMIFLKLNRQMWVKLNLLMALLMVIDWKTRCIGIITDVRCPFEMFLGTVLLCPCNFKILVYTSLLFCYCFTHTLIGWNLVNVLLCDCWYMPFCWFQY